MLNNWLKSRDFGASFCGLDAGTRRRFLAWTVGRGRPGCWATGGRGLGHNRAFASWMLGHGKWGLGGEVAEFIGDGDEKVEKFFGKRLPWPIFAAFGPGAENHFYRINRISRMKENKHLLAPGNPAREITVFDDAGASPRACSPSPLPLCCLDTPKRGCNIELRGERDAG